MKKKTAAILMACVLVLGGVIGGTLAWLTDKTDAVTNTFTDSDISITLTETKSDFKMIPGWTIEKDPIVTVKAGSEDCWVFIKVEAEGVSFTYEGETITMAFTDFIEYEIDPNNWAKLKDDQGNTVPGVYVGNVPSKNITADRQIKILLNNQVKVEETVTKEMMDIVEKNGEPKLTFTAYASQLMKDNTTEFTAYEAWQNVCNQSS